VDDDNCSNDCRVVAGTCDAPVDLALDWASGLQAYVWRGNLAYHSRQRAASCLAGTEAVGDVVVRFTAPSAGTWEFRYDLYGPADAALTLLGNECSPGATEWECVAGDEPSISRWLAAGETVYLSLDGTLHYTFQVTASLAACGDGLVQVPEECDDGNTVGGDNCAADCRREGLSCEAPWTLALGEPWHDVVEADSATGIAASCAAGSESWQTALGRFTAPVAGRYAFRVMINSDQGGVFSLRRGGCGAEGTESLCGVVERRTLTLFTADLAAGETVYPAMASRTGIFPLWLWVDPLVCGDGRKVGLESCDDGNTVSGDGCSSTCELENAEAEPNDDPSRATPWAAGEWIRGSLGEGDVDLYRFTVPDDTQAQVELSLGGLDDWCIPPGPGEDFVRLRLLDENGGLLVESPAMGRGYCPQLSFRPVAGRTHYLAVVRGEDAAGTIEPYFLRLWLY
jgi:cysteine-rich repeat protein